MKTILYVNDVLNINLATLEFSCYLCNLSRSKLVGIFLENLDSEVRAAKVIKEVTMEVKPV